MTLVMPLILMIIFIAAVLHGSVGFGFALVAMPALALIMDTPSAAALVALSATFLSGIILLRTRRSVHVSEAAGLIIAAAAGVPAGIAILAHAPREIVIIILGVLISAFSLYSLLQPAPIEIRDRRWRYLAGFLGGLLGGAYNTNGPPIVIYGAMRRWPPERFLAVTQAFFLPTGLMVVTGHAVAGFWTREVLLLFCLSLPGLFVANYIGKRIAARMSTDFLSKAVYGLCLILGMVIVVTNLG